MSAAVVVRQMRASRPKEGVSKGKTTPTLEGLVSTLFEFYDYENQRIYTDMPGINPWNGQKFYYWDQSGHIIGEGKVGKTITFKYTQMSESRNSRITQMHTEAALNYQVSNTVSFPGFRALRDSDNINNAICKINLDEWGNVGDKTTGPQQEINYTGKKMDIPTRLYYFNQRYYDPEIGRFGNEDPAGQAFNPYLYCGNNPLVYVDPDGQFGWVVAGAIAGAVIANWEKPVTLENTFYQDRNRYYTMIQQARELDNDLTYWIEYNILGILETLTATQKRIESLQIQSQNNKLILTRRQEEVLRFIKHKGRVQSHDIEMAFKLTRSRVNQIIKPLVDAQILLKKGQTRATTYCLPQTLPYTKLNPSD